MGPTVRQRRLQLNLDPLVRPEISADAIDRVGARPTAPWQPAREVYDDLAWPPGGDVPAASLP